MGKRRTGIDDPVHRRIPHHRQAAGGFKRSRGAGLEVSVARVQLAAVVVQHKESVAVDRRVGRNSR